MRPSIAEKIVAASSVAWPLLYVLRCLHYAFPSVTVPSVFSDSAPGNIMLKLDHAA